MANYKTMDGNEAASRVAYMFSEVAGIYPITPSSVMAEHVDEWSVAGEKNIFNDEVKVVQMQSEAGAAGMIHGSLQSGLLTTTFTSSQGLLLMIPNMYKMAGEMLPAVMHVAARSIATHALSILGDHQDIYATRMTGFAMLSSSSVQQVMNLSAVAHLSAIKASLPVMHFFDGFRTSHEIKKINVLEKEDLIPLVDKEALSNFRKKSLSPFNKVIRGTAQNEDIYFQSTEVRNEDYNKMADIVNDYMMEINKITGKNYKPFNYHGDPKATKVIVAMGSVCDTIKEVVRDLNKRGERVGLIEVHLYRPFSSKYLLDVLPKTTKKIAVLDRTKEPGSVGEPLYLDVVEVINKLNKKIEVIGGRYGLSSKDTDPSQIKAVYDFLDNRNKFSSFTIGITDDVTNLSLPENNYQIDNKKIKEFLIYGFGSDGMITASKDIIKIVGDHSNNYVQGYFQYDSKKSGSMTRSHLRFGPDPIKSAYFVKNPEFVVCTKETYITRYDMLSNIREKGIFLYVTSKSPAELKEIIPYEMKKILYDKKIKFYTIDAYALASKHGLQNKISMIMEACIFKISNIFDYDEVIKKVKEKIVENFSNKGDKVVNANIACVDEVKQFLHVVDVDDTWLEKDSVSCKVEPKFDDKIFNKMMDLSANDLKVSDFIPYKDGTYLSGTSQYEKRDIAEDNPLWLPENCIQCNQCSFVCPHAVIRPFLLNEEEFNNAPREIQEKCVDALGLPYKYLINVSLQDCTGCGICARTCPGKGGDKALKMMPVVGTCDATSEYLLKNVTEKTEVVKPNVKFSQFKTPLFEYSGACAGCGETPYLKLLSQLFGDRMVIANATGCTSIYGASTPSMPWKVAWANSLFEDNAEFGYGMLIGANTMRNRIKNLIEENLDKADKETQELLNEWLSNYDDYEITKKVYDNLNYKKVPYLENVKEYIPSRSVWTIGGDGWAYDIGFSGIDHVLSSNDNVNILVLDSQVYSNTGGQSSKASERGSIAKFTASGKKTSKKDLARIAMSYPNVYVASVCMGANMQQTVNALVEAERHDGPSIVIAYSTCITHGIKGGMGKTIEEEKAAVGCGYVPIFRYDGANDKFTLDFKEPNFDSFQSFLDGENRFAMLKKVNEEKAEDLQKQLKEDAIKRFNYYKSLADDVK
jgi:pyruvate-ferredoxin/flavodoxin oxidoreductase